MTFTRELRDKPNVWTHQGFLLAEDEMVKSYLSGIMVPGRDEGAPEIETGVWFRWPEGERQIKYPFITIDLLSADPNYALFHSDYIQPPEQLYRPSYSPDIPAPALGWGKQSLSVRSFLPMTLQYQIAVHARSARHARYLQSICATDVLPPRPIWLWCVTDEKWRRAEVTQANTSDLSETTESGTKRIFRRVYTLSVMAEIPQDVLTNSDVYRALRVLIPVVDREMFDDYHESLISQHDYLALEGVEVPLPS
jgi:hypothetical protein